MKWIRTAQSSCFLDSERMIPYIEGHLLMGMNYTERYGLNNENE